MSQAAAKCARWSRWGRDGVSFTFTCCVCPRFSLLFFFSFPLSLTKMKSHSLYSTLFAFGPLWKMNRIKFYESVFLCVRVSVRIYIMRNFHFFFLSPCCVYLLCSCATSDSRSFTHAFPSSTMSWREGRLCPRDADIYPQFNITRNRSTIYLLRLLLLASLFSLFI